MRLVTLLSKVSIWVGIFAEVFFSLPPSYTIDEGEGCWMRGGGAAKLCSFFIQLLLGEARSEFIFLTLLPGRLSIPTFGRNFILMFIRHFTPLFGCQFIPLVYFTCILTNIFDGDGDGDQILTRLMSRQCLVTVSAQCLIHSIWLFSCNLIPMFSRQYTTMFGYHFIPMFDYHFIKCLVAILFLCCLAISSQLLMTKLSQFWVKTTSTY